MMLDIAILIVTCLKPLHRNQFFDVIIPFLNYDIKESIMM